MLTCLTATASVPASVGDSESHLHTRIEECERRVAALLLVEGDATVAGDAHDAATLTEAFMKLRAAATTAWAKPPTVRHSSEQSSDSCLQPASSHFCHRVWSMPLGSSVEEQLRDSYDALRDVPPERLRVSARDANDAVSTLSSVVDALRAAVEDAARRRVDPHSSLSMTSASLLAQLASTANTLPMLTTMDMLRILVQPAAVWHFNPLLTTDAAARIYELTVLWAQLCVLSDRLQRCRGHLRRLLDDVASTPEETGVSVSELEFTVSRELACRRTWPASAFPEWLALEVEGRLQIRPQQSAILMELIEAHKRAPHGGATSSVPIAQLNMGLGKTRVPGAVLFPQRAAATVLSGTTAA